MYSNLSCILSTNTLVEAIIIGVITLVIGTIAFNLSLNKINNKDEKPYSVYLAFFITGFILHFFIEIIGLNKWYCDKCLL